MYLRSHGSEIVSQLFLRKDVHLCVTDNAAVFLDLSRDKYLGLNAESLPPLLELMSASVHDERHVRLLADGLQAQALTTTDPSLGYPLAPLTIELADKPLPVLDSPEQFDICADVKMRDVLTLLMSYLRATFNLRCHSLRYAIHNAKERKQRLHRESTTSNLDLVKRLVHVFQRIRPLIYTAHNKCILDSATLVEFLAYHDIYPTWVLGVKTGPFRAHSWVQYGQYVLNDNPVETRRYTPILAV